MYIHLVVFILLFIANVYSYGETLFEPTEIPLISTGAEQILYVRLCDWSVITEDGYYVNQTAYCYCTHISDDTSCSIPGPTLVMKENTVINVRIVNQLTGSDKVYEPNSSYVNTYKDMDTTNLHVHGLHVSPKIDDILLTIPPGGNLQNYPYNFSFHYPGTHWFHAHHHGSTTWQVGNGLHGAILMTADDSYPIDDYAYTTLLFEWILPSPWTDCLQAEGSPKCQGEDIDDANYVYENRYVLFDYTISNGAEAGSLVGMCDIYCQFPFIQRNASGYRYDLTTNIPSVQQNNTLWLTNGQISPVIPNIPLNYYHRLRLINSFSNFFIQYKFPGEYCDWHLISTDGVYINSNNRAYNLSQSTHNNMLFQSPGQRLDVLVRCTQTGTYHINTTQNSSQDSSVAFFPKVDDTILFSIQVTDTTGPTGTDRLPNNPDGTDYNLKPVGTYIENLFSGSPSVGPIRDTCLCPVGDNCTFHLAYSGPAGGLAINNKQFYFDVDSHYPYTADSLLLVEQGHPYTFIINNDFAHVYHQHINPFQVGYDVGTNGYLALNLTWWDTFGNYVPTGATNVIPMRFWTRDYKGLIITHCHVLQHEDKGMMGFYGILNRTTYESIAVSGRCPADPTPSTTEEEDMPGPITTIKGTDYGYMYSLSPIVIIFEFVQFIWIIG